MTAFIRGIQKRFMIDESTIPSELRPSADSILAIVSFTVAAVFAVGALYLALQSFGIIPTAQKQIPPLQPSQLIADVPLRPPLQYPNPPPKGIPPQIRCNWFLICGRYVTLNDSKRFSVGDYIEFAEWGFMGLRDRKQGYEYGNEVCKYGRWRAERVPLERADSTSKYYRHRVTLNCDVYYYGIKCIVGTTPELSSTVGLDQLVCNDGSVWVLCYEPVETREHMKRYCNPADISGKYSIREDDGHFKAGDHMILQPDGSFYIDICKSHSVPDDRIARPHENCKGSGEWSIDRNQITLNAYELGTFRCTLYVVTSSVGYKIDGKKLPSTSIACHVFPAGQSGGIWVSEKGGGP